MQNDFDFDVDSWVDQARAGREKLTERKRELARQQQELEAEIKSLDEGLAKIDAILAPIEGDAPRRMTGVTDLAREVVKELASGAFVAEEDLVTEVLKREPLMKQGSIKSALRSLLTKEEIERSGTRGSHTYRWAKRTAGAETPSAKDRLYTALVSAGSDGVPLAKVVDHVGAEAEKILATLVEEGSVEYIPVGEGEWRYRLVPDDEVEETEETDPQPTLFQSTAS